MKCSKCNDTKMVFDENGTDLIECECENLYKETVIRELEGTKRKGMSRLLKHLDEIGFYEAPASTQYHLSEEGGLLEHSLNVLSAARTINKSLGEPIEDDSIVLCSLLHDLGKAGYNNNPYYEPNYLKSGKLGKKPYKRGTDIVPLPHELLSALELAKHIELTDDELFAIIHHNGMYSSLRYELQGKETPLQMIIHFADMWASRVME